MELVEAGVLGEEEIDDPLGMFLLGEEALIDTILNKVSENEAFSEVILEVVAGAATAIKNDEFDAIELNRLNFEERTVIIELLEVFEDTESFAVLQDDVTDIKKIIEHLTVLEDADETAILDLLFSKEEDEESLIVQILNDVDLTRFDGVILTAVKLYCSEIPTPDDEMIAELFGALIGVVEELESFTELKDSVIVIEDIITYIGIDAISGEDVDYFQLLFKIEEGETDSVIRKILNRINGSVFETPIVRAIQTLATPDSDGKYAILESLSEPLPTIIGPLLEVLAATDDISVISDDFVYIEDLVSLLDENGLLEEDSEIDYISLMFKSEGFKEDGVTAEDTLLVKIINVIEPSRYNAALLEAIQGAADEMLDMEDMDASLRVVVDSLLTLLNDAETLTDIKNDVNAISRVIEVLETDGVLSGDGTDAFALLTKNEIDGKTTVHRVLDIFDDGSDLERFVLNVITGLAGGVAAGEIDLGTLQSPASEFVMATMNVLKDTSDVATIRNDVTTISNIIDILDKNKFISDDEENPITIDVIELFTQPGVGSTEHTVIDLVLAEFEDNSHLNPVLLALVQSLATQVRTISVAEPFDMLVGSVADVFTLRSTEDTVVGDVATVAEVFEILASSGVFAPECDATNLLTVKDGEGRTVVDRVVTVLNDNERTQPIVTDFTKLSLSLIMNNNVAGALGDASGSTADVDRVYEDVKTGLDSIISETVNGEHETEEEKKEAVTEAITDIITNVILGGGDSGDGATGGEGDETLAPEMVDIMADIMADHVIENFGGVTAEDLVSSGLYEELEVEVPVVDEDGNPVLDADGNEVTETVTQTQISDSGITDVILNYYDAYLQWLASQSGGSGT